MDEKNIELLKKLKALAERGIDGERDTAAKKLTALMEKYGVTEAELSDETIEEHEFVYKDKYQRKILRQVFYKVNHEREVLRYTSGKGQRSILIFCATAAEAMQARIEYDFYCDLWADEVDLFLEAFVQKHEIFWLNPDAKAPEGWDSQKYRRLGMMIDAMQDRELLKRLEA